MTTEPNESTGLDAFISKEIKARLFEDDWTVTSVAEALDLRRPVLSARVNGRAPFSSRLIDQIAQLLGTSASMIVAGAERRRRQATGAGQTNPGTPTTPTTASSAPSAEVAS